MGANYRADTGSSWPPFSSPSVVAGDIGVVVTMHNDSRQNPPTPTWDGDAMTAEIADSGDGGSSPGRVKIWWIQNPTAGVTNIGGPGSGDYRYCAVAVSGAKKSGVPVQKFEGRAHGTGQLLATLSNVLGTSLTIGGCNANQTDLHMDTSETVIDDNDSGGHGRMTCYHTGSGTHTYDFDWAAGSGYAGACSVEIAGALGGSQVWWWFKRKWDELLDELRKGWLKLPQPLPA